MHDLRYYIEAGDYSQQDLSLSCPAVAEIFFAEDGPISYTLTEDEGAEDALSEDEKQRLQTILAARDQKVKDIQSKPFAWELAAPRRRAAAGAFAAALGTDSGAAGEVDMALLSALQRCEPIGAGWSEQLSMLQQLIQDESHGIRSTNGLRSGKRRKFSAAGACAQSFCCACFALRQKGNLTRRIWQISRTAIRGK